MKPRLQVLVIGEAAFCGHCKTQFGHVAFGRFHPYPHFRPCAVGDNEVWQMSDRGKAQIRSGQRPIYRRKVRFGPSGKWNLKPITRQTPGNELFEVAREVLAPAIIECPVCGSWNRFVDPLEAVS